MNHDGYEIVMNEQKFYGLWPMNGGMRLEVDRQYMNVQLAKTGTPDNG